MDLKDVKERVRRLLAIAEDDAAADAEIEQAMLMARRYMASYQLERDDIVERGDELDLSRIEWGDCFRPYRQTRRASLWESLLATWVCDFVGTVKSYQSSRFVETRLGKRTMCKGLIFYGPTNDAVFAAEVFEEVQEVVATLAYHRYGAIFRGDGGSYSEGFVDGLRDQLQDAKDVDRDSSDEQTRALAVVQDQRQLAIVDGARNWLADVKGIKLRHGHGLSGVNAGFNSNAHGQGRSEGRKYSVGSTRRAGNIGN